MSRFFFDLHDGAELIRDTEGSEHSDLSAAEIEAADTLTQVAREIFLATERETIRIEIRDEGGKPLMSMTLRLERALH